MGRAGARNLSLFHQLGITLVILGMLQSIAPTYFRSSRSALRIQGRLRVALAALAHVAPTEGLVWTGLPLTIVEAVQDQESDQGSQDSESLAETFTWSLALSEGRSAQRLGASASPGAIARPRSGAERTLSSLQHARALPILADSSSNVTSRLCRFRC